MNEFRTEFGRFEDKVFPVTESGCWLWIGGCTDQGYGGFWFNGKTLAAHRVSYELYKGSLNSKDIVMHVCDTKSCVNPNHLRKGTYKDNSEDMVAKSRQATGIRAGSSKLTEELVREIRELDLPSRKIASIYGISKTNVLDAKNNKIWRNI